MKNNLLTLIVLFAFISIIIYTAIISLGQIQNANLGTCALNSTGSLVNCSLSNAQYTQQTTSATTSTYYFNTLQLVLWLLILGIFSSAGYLLLKTNKSLR